MAKRGRRKRRTEAHRKEVFICYTRCWDRNWIFTPIGRPCH
jgi:hypothetical protein